MSNSHTYLKEIFDSLLKHCKSEFPFNQDNLEEVDLTFISTLEEICQPEPLNEQSYEKAQYLIERIIANYSHITPALNRDILWLLGGNCLHFLVDDEIKQYQALDELLYDAENNNKELTFQQAKTTAFKLH